MTDSIVHILLHDVLCSSHFPLINLLNILHLFFAKKPNKFSILKLCIWWDFREHARHFIANTYLPQIGKCQFGTHPSRSVYFSLGQKWWGTIFGIRIICILGEGSLRFYLGFGGSHHVLIVFPTSSQLCSPMYSPSSQCVSTPPHGPPTILGIRIICMLGGEFEILFGFWWFPPCSHCVPKKFPTMLPNVFPKFPMCFHPHGPPTILGIRIICMLGGVWDFIWVLWFPPCSHCVPNRFPMVLNNAPNVFPTGSQCGAPTPPPTRESNKF
jgi:hypothetical protein